MIIIHIMSLLPRVNKSMCNAMNVSYITNLTSFNINSWFDRPSNKETGSFFFKKKQRGKPK